MDPRDLAYFEVIAETGHLGRAAQRLGRTQPALTKVMQIRSGTVARSWMLAAQAIPSISA